MKKNYSLLFGLMALCCTLQSPIFASTNNEAIMWSLICPDDVTVNCDAEIWDLSIYGNAQYHDQYGYHSAGTPVVTYYLGGCGSGYITRKWTIEDPYWNLQTCTQTITVGGGAFDASSIVWPQMVTVEGCDPDVNPEITGKPTWVPSECSMLGYSYKDALYTVSADCKKILRKWTIIDWCMTNTGNSNYTPSWTYTQTIKIISKDLPVVNCLKDITVSAYDCKNGKVVSPPLVIDPSSCGGQFEIINNSPYAKEKFADLSGTYPLGTTKVTFTVKYGCGQKKTCTTNVIVKNDKGPVPVCIGNLSVALMGIDSNDDGINDQGMVELWAKDLNWKSYSTCNNYPLTYSFTTDPKVMSKVFTCDQVGKSKVKMYVTDSKGNQSFCEVELDIQNNGANIQDCKPLITTPPQKIFSAKGNIKNMYDEALKNVSLQLYDPNGTYTIKTTLDSTLVTVRDSFKNLSGYWLFTTEQKWIVKSKIDTIANAVEIFTATSDEKGQFIFDHLIKKGTDCTIKCLPYNAALVNIDKADLDHLTKYLLGQATLTELQKIAADIDQNGKIDIEDMNVLFKYIKGDISSFGAKSHIIIASEVDRNQWLLYSKVEADITNVQFTIIQLGDIVKEVAGNTIDNESIESAMRTAQVQAKQSIRVAPNPFTNALSLEYASAKEGQAALKIMDSNGRIIAQQNITLIEGINTYIMDASSWPTGIYIYQWHVESNVHSGKVIKN